jgi:DNA polymerase-3 subunit beta
MSATPEKRSDTGKHLIFFSSLSHKNTNNNSTLINKGTKIILYNFNKDFFMKIIISKEKIIEGLQKASGIIPARSGAAYLRSVWLKAEKESLIVMSTDANIEFTGKYAASVEQEGLAGVQGRAFVDLVRQLPGGEFSLSLDADSGNLLLSQGRRNYKLPVNDSAWFQAFSDFPLQKAVIWSGDFLQELIEGISFCISDDDNADAIGCLYMKPVGDGRIESCGLNGHQFALKSFVHDELAVLLPQEGILIQKKYVQEIKKWLGNEEIQLNISEKRLYLRTEDERETFSLPLSTYSYPDYMSFMSKLSSPEVSVLEINRKEFMEALGRLSIFATDNDRCTYFDFSENEISMTAQGQDVGSADEILEAVYKGNIEKIAFPTRNLMDVMGHYTSQSLTLNLTAVEGPCGITGKDDPEYRVIIMPMKITDTTYYDEEDA